MVPPKYSPYWTYEHFSFFILEKKFCICQKKIKFLKFLSNWRIIIQKCKLHISSISSQKKTLTHFWWKRIRLLPKIKNPLVFKKSKCKIEQGSLEFRTFIYWQNSKLWRKIPNNWSIHKCNNINRYSNHQIIAFFEEKNRESTVFVGFKKSYRMIRILMKY